MLFVLDCIDVHRNFQLNLKRNDGLFSERILFLTVGAEETSHVDMTHVAYYQGSFGKLVKRRYLCLINPQTFPNSTRQSVHELIPYHQGRKDLWYDQSYRVFFRAIDCI